MSRLYAIDSVLLQEKRKYVGYFYFNSLWEWGRVSGLYHHKSNPPFRQCTLLIISKRKKTPNTILISFLILWFIWFYFYYPFYARLNVVYLHKKESSCSWNISKSTQMVLKYILYYSIYETFFDVALNTNTFNPQYVTM